MRVSVAGGTATPLTTLSEGATTQRWPQALPSGKGVLFAGVTRLLITKEHRQAGGQCRTAPARCGSEGRTVSGL
jgi:hypothetical protein